MAHIPYDARIAGTQGLSPYSDDAVRILDECGAKGSAERRRSQAADEEITE
jgi:hypothetical protein